MATDSEIQQAMGDVTQKDLGDFINKSNEIHQRVTYGFFMWVKSVITFIMSIVMVILVATLDMIPKIFALLKKCIDLITGVQLPDSPGQLPGAEWLAITNTFFPLKEACAALSLYYGMYFVLLVVRVCVSIAKFGLKYTIQIFKLLATP